MNVTQSKETIVQPRRAGDTITTSVSISREFKELMDSYHLSPSEVVRRGIAVTLHDMGIEQYQSQTNHRRSEFLIKFMHALKKQEEEWQSVSSIMHLVDELIKIRPYFEEASK